MTPPRVKLCGFTRDDDVAHAAQAGADYLGLNLWPRSKRHVSVARAAALAAVARAARADVQVVGLFVDAAVAEILAAVTAVGLDVVQLHGDEPVTLAAELAGLAGQGVAVWKAHAIGRAEDLAALDTWPADAHLLDAPSAGRGGSGTTFDWALAARAVAAGHRVVLAGGLTPDNVAAAIAATWPYAVDVASGIERAPGHKDAARVTAFLAAVRATTR